MKKTLFVFTLAALTFFSSFSFTQDITTLEVNPKPNLFVLSIGVNYIVPPEKDIYALDAIRLDKTINKKSKELFASIESKVLILEEANRANIIKQLQWISEKTTEKDMCIVFFSTHGNDKGTENGGYVACPWDTFLRQYVWAADIKEHLGKIKGTVLLILDTCHAGAILRDWDSGPKVIIIGACMAHETASETAFEIALDEGLHGNADYNNDGIIVTDELRKYLVKRVPELDTNSPYPQNVVTRAKISVPLVKY